MLENIKFNLMNTYREYCINLDVEYKGNRISLKVHIDKYLSDFGEEGIEVMCCNHKLNIKEREAIEKEFIDEIEDNEEFHKVIEEELERFKI